GNCASSFVQGLHYYRNARESDRVPGLMHVNLGGYHVRDVEIAAAIDIDRNKVGKDLAEAIYAWPNNTITFAKVPKTGIVVQRGMTHDGLGKYLSKIIQKAPGSTVDIVKLLKDTGTDVVVNYLPVGSEAATKWYVEQVLEAGCAFVNCIPVFIAREKYWQQRFEKRGLPLIGDDIKSQVGATITHRVLAHLFVDRGVRIDRTYQLNFGGNTDFLNMLERERLESKKISKTSAVTSIIPYAIAEDEIHVGPSGRARRQERGAPAREHERRPARVAAREAAAAGARGGPLSRSRARAIHHLRGRRGHGQVHADRAPRRAAARARARSAGDARARRHPGRRGHPRPAAGSGARPRRGRRGAAHGGGARRPGRHRPASRAGGR